MNLWVIEKKVYVSKGLGLRNITYTPTRFTFLSRKEARRELKILRSTDDGVFRVTKYTCSPLDYT